MANSAKRLRRLWDEYAFPGFRPLSTVRGVFGDRKARVITFKRRSKKALRLLWSSAHGLVRPTHAARSRSAVWRRAHLCVDLGGRRIIKKKRESEERAARLPGGQPLLYQALCLLRGATLSSGHHQGRCGGIKSSLGTEQ